MKYLGIDYGKRKVGLALSEGLTVSPLSVIEVSSLTDAVNKISHVVKKEEIDKVIIGLPDSGEAKKLALNFKREIENNLKNVEIILSDETLSSHNAKLKMLELNIGQKRRQKEDSFSAALMLERFLEN